jgi:hypothetical protein
LRQRSYVNQRLGSEPFERQILRVRAQDDRSRWIQDDNSIECHFEQSEESFFGAARKQDRRNTEKCSFFL